MAPIDWKSLQERMEAEATRLAGELQREAERLAAQAKDPAVQARFKQGAREVGQQALEALEQAAAAAQVALAEAQQALKAQQAVAPETPAGQGASMEGQSNPLERHAGLETHEGPPTVRKSIGPEEGDGPGASGTPASPPKKTVGPRKNSRSTGKM